MFFFIKDHSINGVELPPNLVVIAACNPARTRSLTLGGSLRECDLGKEFFSGHYQVFEMPPAMCILKWSYGSLDREQEKEFIYRRIKMLNHCIPTQLQTSLSTLVSVCHETIRVFAAEHIYNRLLELFPNTATKEDAQERAKAMVSLRDIQRVFSLFEFFMSDTGKHCIYGSPNYHRVMLLTVALVYYIRLDSSFRRKLLEKIESIQDDTALKEDLKEDGLLGILENSMDLVVKEASIPAGIALTNGLKENIFTTLVCTLSRTPLMIIGPPGTSKVSYSRVNYF